MFEPVNFSTELDRLRIRIRSEEEMVVQEANRILRSDLFADRKILDHLTAYSSSFNRLDEEEVATDKVYTVDEIRRIAVKHRLKFLPSGLYKPEIPYEAILKIRELNSRYRKELSEFHVLSVSYAFREKCDSPQSALFVETNCRNFFLVHDWGNPVHWSRKLKYWPLRSFENLVVSLLVLTLIVTLCLPTALITLDAKAEYWSGYRAAAFFHLLIFFSGFTTYLAFAFSRNFSNVVWNRKKDFG